MQGIKWKKKGVKQTLFTDDIIMCVETVRNFKDSY